jgi:tetratricopeptide (TPR) repeat protein
VYAVAAAEFMAAFYERLFAGDTVSTAVTAGRQRLFRHNVRPSPKGNLPLADWMVPVHYLRREVRFPDLVTSRQSTAPSLEEALDQFVGPGPREAGGALTQAGVFIGRDELFYQLETAGRLQKVVVLYGPAGTGKTELAKAFGRWWQDTGGVEQPDWVFWHSFEPGLASFGIDGVITEIGLTVFGTDFAQLDSTERIGVVEAFLRDRSALLIWDNFESVRSIPEPSSTIPPLGESECQRLRNFLHRLAAGGRSVVLITSRSVETWLDEDAGGGSGGIAVPVTLRRIRVAGLTHEEATQYAGDLLAPYPSATGRRADRAFGELMQWLNGHPLSMRLTLPHLDTTDPKALLAGLRGTTPLPGWDDSQGGRLTSLPASLEYSYAHLDPAHQRLLVAVSLVQGTVNAVVLGAFSGADEVPQRFQGVSWETWGEILDAAAAAGLMTSLGRLIYQIHPALPAYLAARWRADEGATYDDQRAIATRALLSAYNDYCEWLRQQIISGDAGGAYAQISLEQRTIAYLLGYALDKGFWPETQAIAQPLVRYWHRRGLRADANAWADRIRLATESADGDPPELSTPAGSLWFLIATDQALYQANSRQLDAADHSYRDLLEMLEAQPTGPRQKEHLAIIQASLGGVARGRGRLDEATGWLTQSLAICEELGDRLTMASNYIDLGDIAKDQGRLDEAATCYARSLATYKEIGNRSGLSRSYGKLGLVALIRGQLDEAAIWYTRSLDIRRELGDQPEMARMYHSLGLVARTRGRLDEAASWYTRSLAICEKFGDRPGLAGNYHELGLIAHARGRLDEAADWYARSRAISEELGNRGELANTCQLQGSLARDQGRLDEAADLYARCLAIYEQVGDRPGLATVYSDLGLLAEEQRNFSQALEWAVCCVALFDDVPHPGSGTGPDQLARLGHQLGMRALKACWRRVTGDSLPGAVRDYVRSYRLSNDNTPRRS